MSDERVIVLRSFDPTGIELAEAQLRAAQIPFTRAGRGNAALLGVGNSIVEQVLEVDAADADEARSLLANVEAPAEAVDDAEASAEPARRSAFVAAGLSLLWPGLGFLCAGMTLVGLALGLWCLLMLAWTARSVDPMATLVFGQLIPRVLDLCVSQLWLRSVGRRSVAPLAQLVIAPALLGALYGAHQPWARAVSQELDWPFDQAVDVASVSDAAVVERGAPILLVAHLAHDHSWYFLSGAKFSPAEGKVISMKTALELDPTLRTIADLPPGWSAQRKAVGQPWKRAPDAVR